MRSLYGVVKGDVVILPEDANLPDGLTVEIRPVEPDPQQSDAAEEQFLQRLLELGLLTEIKRPPRIPPEGDRTPIQVEGTPLSEMIIQERR